MSATHVYVVDCDAPGCGVRWGGALHVLAAKARAEAKEAGWLHVTVALKSNGPSPSVDLCPAHVDLSPRIVAAVRRAAQAAGRSS